MSDERRQRLLDQYEDAALQLLMDEYAEAEGAQLMKEFEAAEQRGEVEDIPEELDLKCKQIIHKSFAENRRKQNLSIAAKALGKVAVLLLMLTGLSTTIVLSVEAFRIPVLNYLISQDVRFSTLLFMDESDNAALAETLWDKITIEDCMPLDYSLICHQAHSDGASTFIFSNESNNLITVNIDPSEGMFNYDAENAQQELIKINNFDAIFVSGENYRVIWFNAESKYLFDVTADNLSEIDFWKLVYRLAELE